MPAGQPKSAFGPLGRHLGLFEGAGFGLLWNIIIGIAGAFVAGWLFPRLGPGLTLGGGIVGAIVAATLGAVVLLLVVNLIQRLLS